jgi:hypothetical protein
MNAAHIVFLASVNPAIWFVVFFPIVIAILVAHRRRKGGQ